MRSVYPQMRRFAQLSPARKALVRLFQEVNFGEIQGVRVRGADPIFDEATVVVLDVRLDKDDVSRHELDLGDFELRVEVNRLMAYLDDLKEGTIQRLEVRAGIPYRFVFESQVRLPYDGL